MTYPVNGDMECWQAPQSPFQILYSRLVLEQIRLAVSDAYFVVPHGGVEIGGVLLGKYADRQVEVIDRVKARGRAGSSCNADLLGSIAIEAKERCKHFRTAPGQRHQRIVKRISLRNVS